MSQDSWEDSIWAQPEPSPPEADGADHRGDEVKDGLPVTALTKEANGSNKMTHHLAGLVGVITGCIDREIVQRAISETLLEQDSDAYRIRPTRPLPHQAHRYHLYNHVCKPIVREALGQQGDEVRLSKVHAYLLKELGVNASKDELPDHDIHHDGFIEQKVASAGFQAHVQQVCPCHWGTAQADPSH